MQAVRSSAPGKMILAGEYAVLDGAPALAMAVNRRASVTLSPIDAGRHSLAAPGLFPGSLSFSTTADGVRWHDGAAGPALLECVFRTLQPSLDSCYAFTIDSTAFADPASGRKFGIGSSAAVCVALLAALATAGGVAADLDAAIEAHRQFQGGLGSGADIACASAGGLVEFRRGNGGGVVVSPRSWPADLEFAALWSGVAADSRSKIAAFEQRPVAASRNALADAAERLAGQWAAGSVALPDIGAYVDCLRAFDADHRLGIFAAGHDRLSELATTMGAVYKPCGAGGGDLGLLIAEETGIVAEFLAGAAAQGFTALDLKLEARGVETRGGAAGSSEALHA